MQPINPYVLKIIRKSQKATQSTSNQLSRCQIDLSKRLFVRNKKISGIRFFFSFLGLSVFSFMKTLVVEFHITKYFSVMQGGVLLSVYTTMYTRQYTTLYSVVLSVKTHNTVVLSGHQYVHWPLHNTV